MGADAGGMLAVPTAKLMGSPMLHWQGRGANFAFYKNVRNCGLWNP